MAWLLHKPTRKFLPAAAYRGRADEVGLSRPARLAVPAARTGRQQRFWEGDRNPDIYGIAVGSFADPNFPPPTSSGREEVMHPLLGVRTTTEHFPQGRP